ncbi:MAG: MATE family efflux transporter, partial [Kofleriaceae bacterium]
MSGAPPSAPAAVATRPSLRALAALALPMVLARATQSVITFADTYQIKGHGADALAAVATGGINVFLIVILPMGTCFILQSFVAQRVGRGEREQTVRYAWYGLAMAAAAGLVALLALPAVRPVIGLLGFEPEVKALMGDYMLIRLLS